VNGVVKEGVVGASLTAPPPAVTTPGVPEPATWALMLGGFMGVGSLLRRNRGQLAV
jgi:hypothetical protein